MYDCSSYGLIFDGMKLIYCIALSIFFYIFPTLHFVNSASNSKEFSSILNFFSFQTIVSLVLIYPYYSVSDIERSLQIS